MVPFTFFLSGVYYHFSLFSFLNKMFCDTIQGGILNNYYTQGNFLIIMYLEYVLGKFRWLYK